MLEHYVNEALLYFPDHRGLQIVCMTECSGDTKVGLQTWLIYVPSIWTSTGSQKMPLCTHFQHAEEQLTQ